MLESKRIKTIQRIDTLFEKLKENENDLTEQHIDISYYDNIVTAICKHSVSEKGITTKELTFVNMNVSLFSIKLVDKNLSVFMIGLPILEQPNKFSVEPDDLEKLFGSEKALGSILLNVLLHTVEKEVANRQIQTHTTGMNP